MMTETKDTMTETKDGDTFVADAMAIALTSMLPTVKDKYDPLDVVFMEPVETDQTKVGGPFVMCIEDHKRPPARGVILSDLIRPGNGYVHEVYGFDGQRLKPIYDYEVYFDTKEELEKNKWIEWEKCIGAIRAVSKSNVVIHGCEACGYKKAKGKWVASFHCVSSKGGAYACGADMLRDGIVPDVAGFDRGIYKEIGSRQTMRMVGADKTGEGRPFRPIVNMGPGKWASVGLWQDDVTPDTRMRVMAQMLAQISDGEDHVDLVPIENKTVSTSAAGDVLGMNGQALGRDIKINSVDQIRELCKIAGMFGEVNRDYDSYVKMILMLSNIADDNGLNRDEMKALVHELAAVCPNNNARDVEATFRRSQGRSVTMRRVNLGHLRRLAKEKDPEAYEKWMTPLKEEAKIETVPDDVKVEMLEGDKKKISRLVMLSATELNDADVAEALIHGGWLDNYIWDYSDSVMYTWNGTYWKPSTKDILANLIQSELHKPLSAYVGTMWKGDKNECKCYPHMSRLRNSRSTDGIIKSVCGMLMHLRPIDGIEWNAAPFKLAFENGVLNLTTGMFEAGTKTDYITITTGWVLPLDVNKNIDTLRAGESGHIAKICGLYEKIQPNPEIRNILWQIMGACLVGQILENVFVFTGEGRNGKSVTTDILKCILGKFAYRGDDATIQRDPGSATNQAVVNMRDKRMTLFSEPHEGYKLRTSTLKDLTGSGETHARGLYSSKTSVRLTHKLIIECNGGVNYDKVDQAIEKRTIIVPFPSLFTTQQEIDTMPPETEGVYLVNPKYKTDEWRRKYRVATLLKMIDGLREMIAVSGGKFILSKIPECMRAVKHEFLENSDEIGAWFFENYERSEEKDACVKLADVHESFLNSRTYSNWTKSERRTKGTKKFISDKLMSNPKLRPYYRERFQPRTAEGQQNLRNVLLGFVRVSVYQ